MAARPSSNSACWHAPSISWHSSTSLSPLQFMSNIPALAALLEAVAALFVALPRELATPESPDHLDALSEATLNLNITLGFLTHDLLAACHIQWQGQQAQQAQQPEEQAQQQEQQAQQQQQQQVQPEQPEQPPLQPAAWCLNVAAMHLASAVVQKQHWLLSEEAAALAGAGQPSSLVLSWVQPAERSKLALASSSWLRAGQALGEVLRASLLSLPLPRGSSATFCATAATVEAMLRMQPLFAQLAAAICAEAAAGSELESEAAGLLDAAGGWPSCCNLVLCWLEVTLLPTPDAVPDCCRDASAVRAACQLASCAAKHAWWVVRHAAEASSSESSSSGLSQAAARSACLLRIWAFSSHAEAARIAMIAAAQHSDDERTQG